MYDKLVKRLRNAAQWADQGLVITPSICIEAANAIENTSKAYQMMAEAYEAEVTKPRWIPVTERLPESGVPTLICGDGNVVEQGFFDDEYGYWYDWGGNRTFIHHWMPLPQPPEEE